MNFTSNFLGQIAKVGLATPGPYETEVEIPPTILPILEFTNPQDGFALSLTEPVTQSFTAFQNIDVNNAAASNADIFTLAPGLWDIGVSYHYVSNWQAATNQTGFELIWRDFATTIKVMRLVTKVPCGLAAALGVVSGELKQRMLFHQAFTMRATLSAAGVGQRHTCSAAFTVNRLL